MSAKFTWYGHGTMGLETGGYAILVDPYFTGNPAASISADQAQADFILVSHGHEDHLGDTVNLAKRTGALVISNAEIAGWLRKQDVDVHAQHIGGGYRHPFGYLKLTQALHGSGLPDGFHGGNPAGFLLTTNEDQKLYMACDTGLFGDMALIGDEGIDLAVIPIGDNYTMGPDDALKAVKLIRHKRVVPVHYSTWDLIKQDPQAWADRVRAETDTEAHVLQPGESIIIP
jgi:L-ascorbate metabolism protein UlaG (beta-lactamase superfamily)